MGRSELGVLANAVAALAFAAVAASVLVALARSGRLRRNRLDLAAALIFVSCAVGHVIQVQQGLSGPSPQSTHWSVALWDVMTAGAAVAYLGLRRAECAAEEGGGLYEDARRRQHELAGQVMAANVREELATERAAAADHRLDRVFAATPVGMAVIDRRGCVTRANPAMDRILGRDADAASEGEQPGWLTGRHLADLVADPDRRTVEALVAAPDAGHRVELRVERDDGSLVFGHLTVTPLADDDGSLLVQIEDATERREAEERLEHLAMHDPLTGLPNRLLFHSRAATALRQAKHTGCYVGCLFVDLDHFKVVNDSLGHDAGDRVLTTMGDRLARVVRPGDTVARMGGDEFCLLLAGLEHQAEAAVVAERVRVALEGFVDLDGVQVTTSGSVGVAVALPGDKATPETLVRDADLALCRAKAEGPSRTVLFDAELREAARRRLLLGGELRHALSAGELDVVYQPQWSLRRERVVGVEALVRWRHPRHGELLGEDFLPVAAETGLLVEVGRFVLATALRARAAWQPTAPDLRLAVNVAARQVTAPGLEAEIWALLDETAVPAADLCLELGEGELAALGTAGVAALHDLHERGVRIAVDDVGTGQSSLTHLVTLPVDAIKVDRSFVEQVHVAGAKRAIVEALLALGRAIGVEVVADGAETLEQVTALRQLGCDVVQGLATGRPLEAHEITALLSGRVRVGAG